MQTTGKVILNARGVNINGYDCFVNLSKDMRTKYQYFSSEHWADSSIGDPVPGITVFTGISSTKTKFSTTSLAASNISNLYISYAVGEPFQPFSNGSYTLSFWSNRMMITSGGNSIQRGKCPGINPVVSIETFGANNNKFSQARNSSGQWINGSHNVQFVDGNWHHFCFTKNGNRIMIFVDGSMIYDKSGTWYQQTEWNGISLSSLYQEVYYDDLVLIDGQALWTSNFTPPSTYLLDSEYAMDLDQVKRRNIIAANVNKKLIIPDEETLKQY